MFKLNTIPTFFSLLLVVLMIFMTSVPQVYAATSPSLGTAASYSILAGSEVTNTGSTTISGDVGISPGIGAPPHYTGFGTVTLGGSIHDGDGAALTAQADKNAAFANLGSQTCDITYAGTKDLAGEILVPGVYCADAFNLTGTLTLNGSATGVWIFKSASSLVLTGGTAANIIFTGGGLPCNVWWRVVSTATLDANSSLVGNILAGTSVTFASGASLNGRALAGTGAVTLSSNSITSPTCTSPTSVPSTNSNSNSNSGSGSGSNLPSVCVPSEIKGTPRIIEAKRLSPTSIYLSWGPYEGMNTFLIEYGFTNGNWAYNTKVTGFNTIINDLPANQSIWVRVAPTDNCAIGNYSEAKFTGSPLLPNTGFGPQQK